MFPYCLTNLGFQMGMAGKKDKGMAEENGGKKKCRHKQPIRAEVAKGERLVM